MKTNKRLLIIEDDAGLQSQLRWCFDDFEVAVASNREEAVAQMRRHEPTVVTLDLGLPPDAGGAKEGLAVLAEILEINPATKIIVVTGNDDRDNAIKAVGLGAYDFYQKPIQAELLNLIVNRAYCLYDLELENRRLSLQTAKSISFGNIIAASPQMVQICRTIEKLAVTDVSVMLLGESGTGKELLARALHDAGQRTAKNFVAINCAAIPENLLESELFGFEKGAFTGATHQKQGKIERAEGGTLFLDEIGDLPYLLQAKLLRFLQERIIERIGGNREIPIDVRVVCATHQDILALVKKKLFREDLYYRLCEVAVKVPPIREREGDVLMLARFFTGRMCEKQNIPLKELSPAAIKAINTYTWPGNVRELENRIKRAVVMSESRQILVQDLELPDASQGGQESLNLRQVREEAEKSAVLRALTQFNHNIAQAAESLGVSRPTLYHLMEKFNISK